MSDEQQAQSNRFKAYATLRKVLAEIGWGAEPDEENTSFYVDFGPPHVPVSDAMAVVAADTERFLFYVQFGATAPPERRDEIARFITRANWGLSIGNFEMDYEDGDMRFKSSVSFQDVELSETLIRNAILSAMNAVEAYADALIAVVTGEKDAEQAIEEAESHPG